MFTFKQRFMLVAFLFIAMVANAQKINVTGRILDSQQNPLPGAGVVIYGTNSGTTADLDGNYKINVPADAVLEFSYLGHEVQWGGDEYKLWPVPSKEVEMAGLKQNDGWI